MTYRNVDNFVVIGADDRDPATSFENHRRRGSSGGVDVVAPFRTPVHAPDDCTIYLAPDNGTGGNTATLVYADGWRDQMMHLDEFILADGTVPRNGQRLRQGEQFALSGRSGEKGRFTYDPHVHWHRIGQLRRDAYGPTSRYNPFDFFAGTAGGEVTPIEENDMTPDQDRLLRETNQMTGVIKQVLTETQQWKGISATLGDVWKWTGIILQVLTETQAWDGIDLKQQKTLKLLQQIVDKPSAQLSAEQLQLLAGQIAPIDVGELRRLVDEEVSESEKALGQLLTASTADSEARILAAIAGLPEETMRANGWQRIPSVS